MVGLATFYRLLTSHSNWKVCGREKEKKKEKERERERDLHREKRREKGVFRTHLNIYNWAFLER